MSEQTNMSDLVRDLRKITGAMPKMQAAARAVEDHAKRLDQVEEAAALAYDTAKRGTTYTPTNGRAGNVMTPHAKAFAEWLRSPQDSNRRTNLVSAEMRQCATQA